MSSRPTSAAQHERAGASESASTAPAQALTEGAAGGGGVSLLEISALVASYGPVQALHGIDLVVEEGEVVVVLGANGAGKTTTI
ncbi:MAG TPA: ATP-binding cassette domain-containing protein, partial [Acidimicrobiales bacterium]|nr:ATP-binding cassette domain-containing protein [Acidimicrobiales bacterium]